MSLGGSLPVPPLVLGFGQIDSTQQKRKLFGTQDDVALRITGLRPGETPFLRPLGTVGKDTASSGRALDPVPSQQPYLSDLRKSHVAEQREHKDGPVQSRQEREAQRRGQRGIRQPHAKSHD